MTGILVGCAAGTIALAQGMPLGQMKCEGVVAGNTVQGEVYASLWRTAGMSGMTSSEKIRQLYIYLVTGQGHLIPGTVQLFGNMQDDHRNLINFEVFLTGGDRGTGAYWVNGQGHRQTYMKLVIGNGGFTVFPEDGGQTEFNCTE